VTDEWSVMGAAFERPYAARAGIDLRWPYRDRRLLELVASLPAHLLFRPGESKWALRRAMRGLLPEKVRRRRWASSLGGLVVRGLGGHERATVLSLLTDANACWPQFVRRSWMENTLQSWMRAGVGRSESVVPWLCCMMELWYRRTTRGYLKTGNA